MNRECLLDLSNYTVNAVLTKRGLKAQEITEGDVSKFERVCNVDFVSRDLEEMSLSSIGKEDDECIGFSIMKIDGTQPIAIIILCPPDDEEAAKMGYSKEETSSVALLCADKQIRMGQGAILLTLAIIRALENGKSTLVLKAAKNNILKLIPYYARFGFKVVQSQEPGVHMMNDSLLTSLENIEMADLSSRHKLKLPSNKRNMKNFFNSEKKTYEADLEFEKFVNKDDAPFDYKPFKTCHTFQQTNAIDVVTWLRDNSDSFVIYDPENTAYTTCDTLNNHRQNFKYLYACPESSKKNIHTSMYVAIELTSSDRTKPHNKMVVTIDNMARTHASRGRVFRLVNEHQMIKNLQVVDREQFENGKILCNPDALKQNFSLYRLERFYNWSGEKKSLGLELNQIKRRQKRSERPDTDTNKRSTKQLENVHSLDDDENAVQKASEKKNEKALKQKYDLWYGKNTMADVLFHGNIPKLEIASLVSNWEFWAVNKAGRLVPPTEIKSEDIIQAWKVLVNVPKTVQSAAQLRHLRKNTSDRQRWVLAFLQDYLNIQPAVANPSGPSSTVLDLLLVKFLYRTSQEFEFTLIKSPKVLAVVLTFPDKDEEFKLNFNRMFLMAVGEGLTEAVRLLMESKDAQNEYLIEASTGMLTELKNEVHALDIAARNGQAEIVSLLLEAKTIDNTQFRFGQTKLIRTSSLFEASYYGHTKVVSLLLAAKTIDNKELRFAQTQLVRTNSLITAASNGHVELVSFLLQAKNIKNTEFLFNKLGDMTILATIDSNAVEIISLLLEATTLDKQAFRFDMKKSLYVAAKYELVRIVSLLLKAKNIHDTDFRFAVRLSSRRDVLSVAASRGNAELVSLLLRAENIQNTEFRFNEVDDVGLFDTRHVYAAGLGVDTVSLLLEAKTFDKQEFRFDMGRVLYEATQNGLAEVVSLLLTAENIQQTEFRFNEVDGEGNGVILAAAEYQDKIDVDTVSVLLEAKTFDNKEFRFVFDREVFGDLMHQALQEGYTNLASVLLNAENINRTDYRINLEELELEYDLIGSAAEISDAEFVSLLLEAKTFDNKRFRVASKDVILDAVTIEDEIDVGIVSLLLEAKTFDNKEFRFVFNQKVFMHLMERALYEGDTNIASVLLKAENINGTDYRINLEELELEFDLIGTAATHHNAGFVSLLLEAKTFDNKRFRVARKDVSLDAVDYEEHTIDVSTVSVLLEAKTFDNKEFRFVFNQKVFMHLMKQALKYGDTNLASVLLKAENIDDKEFRFMPENWSKEIQRVQKVGNEPLLNALLLAAFSRGETLNSLNLHFRKTKEGT
jgi:ankyrin repeat protein